MIFYSVYNDGFTGCLIYQVAYYSLYLVSPYFIKNSSSVFYSKNSLYIQLVVGVCHGFVFTAK